jgi:hypothetical protein
MYKNGEGIGHLSGIALGYELDDWGFSSPPRPDRLWGPTSLLPNEYEGLFHWG